MFTSFVLCIFFILYNILKMSLTIYLPTTLISSAQLNSDFKMICLPQDFHWHEFLLIIFIGALNKSVAIPSRFMSYFTKYPRRCIPCLTSLGWYEEYLLLAIRLCLILLNLYKLILGLNLILFKFLWSLMWNW